MTNLPYFLFYMALLLRIYKYAFCDHLHEEVVYPDHTNLFYLLKKGVSRPGNVTIANREEEANTKTHLNNEYN